MKHIVQFSGGKDSTCMLLMMLEKGMQVDEIIICDTGMEFPQMYEHIEKVEQYIGRKITRLKAPHSFEWYLYEKVLTKGNNQGLKGYGWATSRNRWCTARMKVDVLGRHLQKFKGEDYIIHIGIAWDEPKRHINLPANIRHPLFEWGVTEKMALSYCKEKGFDWSGLYDTFRRVSCWCCPLQPIGELRKLYHKCPKLWERLKDLDIKTNRLGFENPLKFKPNYSVQDLENKFKREDYLKKISTPLFDVTKYLE